MKSDNLHSLGWYEWLSVVLLAMVCATPLTLLCLRYFENPPPQSFPQKGMSETLAGWPVVYYHSIEVRPFLLPGEAEFPEQSNRVLRRSIVAFLFDLALTLSPAVAAGYLWKRHFQRCKSLGRRVLSSVALMVLGVGGYAILLLMLYVEGRWQESEQRRLASDKLIQGVFEHRCRNFGQHALATFLGIAAPQQLASLNLRAEHRDLISSLLASTDLRTLSLSEVSLGSAELAHLSRHSRLVHLTLDRCQIDGDLRKALPHLPALTQLNLINCRFSQPEPCVFENLPLQSLAIESNAEPSRLQEFVVSTLPKLKLLGIRGHTLDVTVEQTPRLAAFHFRDMPEKSLGQLVPTPKASILRLQGSSQLSTLEIACTHVGSVELSDISLATIRLTSLPLDSTQSQRAFLLTCRNVRCDRMTLSNLPLNVASLTALSSAQPEVVDFIDCDLDCDDLRCLAESKRIRQLTILGPKFSSQQLTDLLTQIPTVASLVASCLDGPFQMVFPPGCQLKALGLIGQPQIESWGDGPLPIRIGVAGNPQGLSDPKSILRYVPGARDQRTLRMSSGEIRRVALDHLLGHPAGAYAVEFEGQRMRREEWRGVDWGESPGISVSRAQIDEDILATWKPLRRCVALRLAGSGILARDVARLLADRRDWRAFDFSRTNVRVTELPQIARYNELEFVSVVGALYTDVDLKLLTALPALRRLDIGARLPSPELVSRLPDRSNLLEIAAKIYPTPNFSHIYRKAPTKIRIVDSFTAETEPAESEGQF